MVISLFTMAPKCNAEVLSDIHSSVQEGCDEPHGENTINFLQACITVLLSISSMLLNQQYTLSRGPLNKHQ